MLVGSSLADTAERMMWSHRKLRRGLLADVKRVFATSLGWLDATDAEGQQRLRALEREVLEILRGKVIPTGGKKR